MAVLIEAISVVTRRHAIHERFRGGWPAFVSSVPNKTLCYDDHLARVGFTTPDDVRMFVAMLKEHGLTFTRNDEAVDFAVVDQRQGPTVATPWIDVFSVTLNNFTIRAAALLGQPEDTNSVAFPSDWAFENSFSQQAMFTPLDQARDHLKFLRSDGKIDVYLDKRTGKEVYLVRSKTAGDGPEIIHARLTAICQTVFDVQGPPLERTPDQQQTDSSDALHHLEKQLLPEVIKIIATAGEHLGYAHFTKGLILQALGRYPDAEDSLTQANRISPGNVSILLELTQCLGVQDKADQALPYARQAVALEPDSPATWGDLAACLIRLRQRDEARKALDRALRLDPNDAINLQNHRDFESNFE